MQRRTDRRCCNHSIFSTTTPKSLLQTRVYCYRQTLFLAIITKCSPSAGACANLGRTASVLLACSQSTLSLFHTRTPHLNIFKRFGVMEYNLSGLYSFFHSHEQELDGTCSVTLSDIQTKYCATPFVL